MYQSLKKLIVQGMHEDQDCLFRVGLFVYANILYYFIIVASIDARRFEDESFRRKGE